MDFHCESTVLTQQVGYVNDEAMETPRPANVHRYMRRWKRGILACATLGYVVLIINVSVTVWAAKFERSGEGGRILKQGLCRTTTRINTLAHVVINILSTLLLASSNYCMQICIAPTREDIDDAHATRHWLKIGVPSLRNLRHVSSLRKVCWILLCISSLPLHLVYNSSVFHTQVATEYLVAEFDEEYLLPTASITIPEDVINVPEVLNADRPDGSRWVRIETNSTARAEAFNSMLTESQNWDNLTVDDCARVYSQPLLASHRSLVLVTKHSESVKRLPGLFRVAASNSWMCDNANAVEQNDVNGPGTTCSPKKAGFALYQDIPAPPGEVLYCLAEPMREECTVEINTLFMAIVSAANGIKSATMTFLFFVVSVSPVLTLGDAITSFMQVRDETTKGLCAYHFESIITPWEASEIQTPRARAWERISRRRFHALSRSKRRWAILVSISAILAIVVLFAMGLSADSRRNTRLFVNIFATKPSNATIGFQQFENWNLAQILLLVNLPQLFCSLLYFFYNTLLTAFLQATEWNNFSLRPTSLRVSSEPKDHQKSSYYLSLPYRYAIPLLILSGTLHWLISQSMFLLKVQFRNYAGGPSERFGGAGYGNMYGEHPGELAAAGYSSLGILSCLVVAVLAYIALALIGMKRLNGDMVIAGSCSTVIAAGCWSGNTTSTETIWEEKVMWGEFGENDAARQSKQSIDAVGHLSFGSGSACAPLPGKLYAGAW